MIRKFKLACIEYKEIARQHGFSPFFGCSAAANAGFLGKNVYFEQFLEI